jgi:hypothetical protein
MHTHDHTAVEFYEAYQVVARRLGIFERHESTENLLKHYKRLAHQCFEEGYGDYLCEFDNDMSVRGAIEDILLAPELRAFEAFNAFQKLVAEIDTMLRASFITGFSNPIEGSWWTRGIVRKGYGDYAEEIKLIYGIDMAKYH